MVAVSTLKVSSIFSSRIIEREEYPANAALVAIILVRYSCAVF
jgi:hypothetical protein